MILKALKSVFSPETGSSGGAPGYFRAFTLHSGSNLAMLDRTGLVLDINPCLQKLLNRGAPALRRQLISDDASRCGDVLKPLLEGRVERLQIERRMISGDGRELLLVRRTEPDQDVQILLDQLGLTLPPQPPPRIRNPWPL